MKSRTFIVFSLLLSIFISCYSDDGLGDTKECQSQRETYKENKKSNAVQYILCKNSRLNENNINFCESIYLIQYSSNEESNCEGPLMPFPFFYGTGIEIRRGIFV